MTPSRQWTPLNEFRDMLVTSQLSPPPRCALGQLEEHHQRGSRAAIVPCLPMPKALDSRKVFPFERLNKQIKGLAGVLIEAGGAEAVGRCPGKSVGWRAMPPAFGLNLKRYGASRPVTTGDFSIPHRTARAVPLKVGGSGLAGLGGGEHWGHR